MRFPTVHQNGHGTLAVFAESDERRKSEPFRTPPQDGDGSTTLNASLRDFVRAIADEPELARLVDELYFEYHFYFDGLDFGWGQLGMDESNTADDALELMQRLRRQGIRAHFWI